MEYRTEDGIPFQILPSTALCAQTMKHPDDMEECPLCICEGDSSLCCPDACELYTERGIDSGEEWAEY